MSSQRTEIRTALQQALTGLPSTGDSVYVNRVRPLALTDLPAILVFSGEADVIDYDTDGLPAGMRWQLRADIIVPDGATAEATADDILDAMCAAVAADATLNAADCNARLARVGQIDLDDSLEKPALRLPVIFEVDYL